MHVLYLISTDRAAAGAGHPPTYICIMFAAMAITFALMRALGVGYFIELLFEH